MSIQSISEDLWRQRARAAGFEEARDSGAFGEWSRERRRLNGGSLGLVMEEDRDSVMQSLAHRGTRVPR